jgi:hypothetical protein
MTKRITSAFLALTLVGCVFHGRDGNQNQPGTADPPGDPNGGGEGPALDPGGIPESFGPTAQQNTGAVRLTILNNSQTAICKMFISPTSDSGWGSDWLGPSEQIMPGTSRVFGVRANSYDLRMTDCSGQGSAPGATLGEQRSLAVQADQTVEVE